MTTFAQLLENNIPEKTRLRRARQWWRTDRKKQRCANRRNGRVNPFDFGPQ